MIHLPKAANIYAYIYLLGVTSARGVVEVLRARNVCGNLSLSLLSFPRLQYNIFYGRG
jgi:hypothetical protein